MGVKFSQLPVASTIADDDYFAVLDTSEGILKRSAISSLSPGQNITQEEYDELTPEQQSHGTYYITDGPTNGITVDTVLSKTSGNPIANEAVANAVGVSMTQDEYDQLSPEQKVTGTYFLTDAEAGNIIVDQALDTSSIHPISNSATATAISTLNSALSEISDTEYAVTFNSNYFSSIQTKVVKVGKALHINAVLLCSTVPPADPSVIGAVVKGANLAPLRQNYAAIGTAMHSINDAYICLKADGNLTALSPYNFSASTWYTFDVIVDLA